MPRKSTGFFLALLAIGSWLLGGCGKPQAAPQSGTSADSVLLNGDDQPLRDDFNRDQSFVRLLFVVDPICAGCLRGLADMGDDVLAKLPKDA